MKTIFSLFVFCLFAGGAANAQEQSKNDGAGSRTTIFVLGGYGYTNRPTQAYIELDEIVSKKNKTALSAWLGSGELVMQLYAIEGYKRLGSEIDAATREQISLVLNNRGSVATANGCMVSRSSVQQIAEKNGYFRLLEK
ncbi:MAG TPA: hypothetical protein VEB40_01985 [Flavipsychrobacter sp.]|nr:hypothetical protein [Flavipsychrobacter sp.]